MDEEKKKFSEEELKEDKLNQKKIQIVCDYALYVIKTKESLTLFEAEKIVKEVKNYALKFFPEKEETFDMIYLPRFQREIKRRFNLN